MSTPGSTYLITGGAGFFGGILKRRLLAEGHDCVSLDLEPDPDGHERLVSVQGDIRDAALVDALFSTHGFDAVFHCAARLAHGPRVNRAQLTSTNVEGTRVIADACRSHGVRRLVFTSTNCLWARDIGRPITEADVPAPIEPYGHSKLDAERLLASFGDAIDVTVIRCPTIVDSGRLGLLAILFEFIADGCRVWVVGDGSNRYQFVYADDLASACIAALGSPGGVFHVGSENVRPLREVFQNVIDLSGRGSRIAELPRRPTQFAMKLAHWLRLSPLGPYHRRMIAESFSFDTSRARQILGWKPTLTNEEMLARAYAYFAASREEIRNRRNVSAHRQAAGMGIIRLLKWIS